MNASRDDKHGTVRQHLEVFEKALVATAIKANKRLSEFDFDLITNQALDMPIESALETLRNLYKAGKAPDAKSFMASATGMLDPKDEAQEISDLIAFCVVRFGNTQVERAKAHMGDLAWLVVERQGGWAQVCSIESQKDFAISKAHWRECARVTAQRARSGTLHVRPSLSGTVDKPGLTPATEIVAQLISSRDD